MKYQKWIGQFEGELIFKRLIEVYQVTPDEYLHKIDTNNGLYYLFEIDFIDNFEYINNFLHENIGGYTSLIKVKRPVNNFMDTNPYKTSSKYKEPEDYTIWKMYANDKFGSFDGYFSFLVRG